MGNASSDDEGAEAPPVVTEAVAPWAADDDAIAAELKASMLAMTAPRPASEAADDPGWLTTVVPVGFHFHFVKLANTIAAAEAFDPNLVVCRDSVAARSTAAHPAGAKGTTTKFFDGASDFWNKYMYAVYQLRTKAGVECQYMSLDSDETVAASASRVQAAYRGASVRRVMGAVRSTRGAGAGGSDGADGGGSRGSSTSVDRARVVRAALGRDGETGEWARVVYDAIVAGDLPAVKALVLPRRGLVDVKAFPAPEKTWDDAERGTMLHVAVSKREFEITAWLLSCGAGAQRLDDTGASCYTYAMADDAMDKLVKTRRLVPPEMPTLTVDPRTPSSVEVVVAWRHGTGVAELLPRAYQLTYGVDEITEDWIELKPALVSPTAPGSVTFVLRDLKPHTVYVICARLRNSGGWGEWTGRVSFETSHDGMAAQDSTTESGFELKSVSKGERTAAESGSAAMGARSKAASTLGEQYDEL